MADPLASTVPRLRPATPADQPFLDQLYASVHGASFLPLALPQEQLDALLRMQSTAQRSSYARDFPRAENRIVLAADGSPVGRVLVDRGPGAHTLVDIALLEVAQGHGLGTRLIAQVQAEAAEAGVPVRLHVQLGSRALQLYTRLGFVPCVGDGLTLAMEWRDPAARAQGDATPQAGPESEDDRSASWRRHQGVLFELGQDHPHGSLRLERVEPHGRNSFSLVFSGAREPLLPQGLYSLHAAGEPEEAVFLVPIERNATSILYEAVFN